MQTVRFTTNIQAPLITFLDSEAHKNKKSRRQVLEEVITWYQASLLRKEMFEAGNIIADDEQEMAEWLSIANNSHNL